jgi:hypothetical protein
MHCCTSDPSTVRKSVTSAIFFAVPTDNVGRIRLATYQVTRSPAPSTTTNRSSTALRPELHG